MICNDRACGCAIETTTLSVSGSGTPDDPWVIDQAELTDITTLQAAVANIQAILEGLPGAYVAKTGDQMSGLLTIVTGSAGLRLIRTGSDHPFWEFVSEAGTRMGYVQAEATNTLIAYAGEAGYGHRWITDGGTERMRIVPGSGTLLVGKTASDVAAAGFEVFQSGAAQSTRSSAGAINYRSNKIGSADVNGEVHFRVDSAGTQIGSITRASSTTTAYNTTSDEDLKQYITSMPDELVLYLLRLVEPLFFEYIAIPGVTQGGYIAQRVAALWPESIQYGVVTPGTGDIANRRWDRDGNEITKPEEWTPWQMDVSKWVPFLHAGWRINDRRITVLEQRVDELSDRK